MSRLKSIVAERAGDACVLGGVGRGAGADATLTDTASRAPIETPFAQVWQTQENSGGFMSRESSRRSAHTPILSIRRSTLRFKGVAKIRRFRLPARHTLSVETSARPPPNELRLFLCHFPHRRTSAKPTGPQ